MKNILSVFCFSLLVGCQTTTTPVRVFSVGDDMDVDTPFFLSSFKEDGQLAEESSSNKKITKDCRDIAQKRGFNVVDSGCQDCLRGVVSTTTESSALVSEGSSTTCNKIGGTTICNTRDNTRVSYGFLKTLTIMFFNSSGENVRTSSATILSEKRLFSSATTNVLCRSAFHGFPGDVDDTFFVATEDIVSD